jgi:hypothetical protein
MMASDSVHAIRPANTGRRLSGRMTPTRAKQPANPPANPTPVTARPTMNMVDEAAVAQRREPTKKTVLDSMKTALMEKRVYILAKPNWNAHEHRRNADAYQPTSATVWKWSVMLGTAVATMLASRPPRIRLPHTARIVNQNLLPVG